MQQSFVVPFGADHPQLHKLISMEGCGVEKIVIVKNKAVFEDFHGELHNLYLNHIFCCFSTIIVPKPYILFISDKLLFYLCIIS